MVNRLGGVGGPPPATVIVIAAAWAPWRNCQQAEEEEAPAPQQSSHRPPPRRHGHAPAPPPAPGLRLPPSPRRKTTRRAWWTRRRRRRPRGKDATSKSNNAIRLIHHHNDHPAGEDDVGDRIIHQISNQIMCQLPPDHHLAMEEVGGARILTTGRGVPIGKMQSELGTVHDLDVSQGTDCGDRRVLHRRRLTANNHRTTTSSVQWGCQQTWSSVGAAAARYRQFQEQDPADRQYPIPGISRCVLTSSAPDMDAAAPTHRAPRRSPSIFTLGDSSPFFSSSTEFKENALPTTGHQHQTNMDHPSPSDHKSSSPIPHQGAAGP